MQSLVALGNLPLPEQEIVRQKWLLDESRAMANLPGSTWTDHHHFHLTNEVAVQGPMEGPLQHQFASRFEAWLTSRAHIFQNDMRAKLHDHRGWRAGDNDVYFAGEALKVQWQPHVRSTGELEKPGTVDIYAVSTRNLSGSAMGLNDFIYPLVQDVLNTGKHKVRLTMAHGIGKACLLVVSGGRDLSIVRMASLGSNRITRKCNWSLNGLDATHASNFSCAIANSRIRCACYDKCQARLHRAVPVERVDSNGLSA